MFSHLNRNVQCSNYTGDNQKLLTASTSGNTFQIEEHFFDNIGKNIPDRETASYSLVSTRSRAFKNCQFFAQTYDHDLATSYCKWQNILIRELSFTDLFLQN